MPGRLLTTPRKANITRKENKMNKKYLTAGIMLTSAFFLWFIASVDADNVGYYQLSDWVLILIGLLLGIGAFPASGDLDEEYYESEDNDMDDIYDVILDVTEQSLNGSYSSQPHTYRKCYSSTEEAKKGVNDLLWECIEIECIESGRILAEFSIEKNGEYLDHDESELEIKVERTNEPSKYFVENGNPIPMSVDRAKSTCFVVE